jgi:hypothetical protein
MEIGEIKRLNRRLAAEMRQEQRLYGHFFTGK